MRLTIGREFYQIFCTDDDSNFISICIVCEYYCIKLVVEEEEEVMHFVLFFPFVIRLDVFFN